jgi:hypothetical protein
MDVIYKHEDQAVLIPHELDVGCQWGPSVADPHWPWGKLGAMDEERRASENDMPKRTATCRCGQLRATCEGEPVRVSVCHCLDCQKRSGSAFAAQARWPDAQVTLAGRSKTWERVADSGHKATYQFCPDCGSTVAYVIEGWPGVTAVPVGAFADPGFPAPKFSVYEHRKHPWIAVLGEDVKRSSTPSSVRNPGASPISP